MIVIVQVSKLMLVSARTAPKSGGVDDILAAIVFGEKKECLAEEMEKIAGERKIDRFKRDAKNVKDSEVVVLIGVRGTRKFLNAFMDKARQKRAQRIKDKELTIQEITGNKIRALIRDYHIVIDLTNRLVLHDCADWSRVLPSKRFCKHIGKLLLSLNKEKAIDILKQIYANKEAWEFKPYTQ